MKKLGTILSAIFVMFAVALLGIVGTASGASAHTGSAYAQESCEGWSASVSLDNNVTADRTVTITSTIPGTPPSTVLHQNTTGNNGPVEVWAYDGPENDISGTVTLSITPDAYGDSASISPAEGCVPPKPEPKVVETSSEHPDCTTKLVTTTHTVTTTDWVLDEETNEWVEAEPVVETTETTRATTAEECPETIVPPAPPAPPAAVVQPAAIPTPVKAGPQLAYTGAAETAAEVLAGLAAVGAGLLMGARRRQRRQLNAW